MQYIKVKHYQHGALRNLANSLLVTLSPRTPRTKRRTYKQIKQTNERRRRDARIINLLKK